MSLSVCRGSSGPCWCCRLWSTCRAGMVCFTFQMVKLLPPFLPSHWIDQLVSVAGKRAGKAEHVERVQGFDVSHAQLRNPEWGRDRQGYRRLLVLSMLQCLREGSICCGPQLLPRQWSRQTCARGRRLSTELICPFARYTRQASRAFPSASSGMKESLYSVCRHLERGPDYLQDCTWKLLQRTILLEVGNLPFVRRYRKGKKKTYYGESETQPPGECLHNLWLKFLGAIFCL